MDIFEEIISNIWVIRIFWSIIVILASTLVYNLISGALARHEKRKSKLFNQKKSRTFTRMFRSITRYALIILSGLIILQIFGIDVSSMLAAAGIASVIVAFAIQDALKDVIRGFDIISDGYYSVGDVVKIGDFEGKVLAVGLKTTRLQDITTGNLVSIANREITGAEIMSGIIGIDVSLSYELPLAKAEAILAEIATKIAEIDNITSAEYRKISNFSESSIDYCLRIVGDPAQRLQNRRDSLAIIAATLEKHKTSIPYPQLDVHTK